MKSSNPVRYMLSDDLCKIITNISRGKLIFFNDILAQFVKVGYDIYKSGGGELLIPISAVLGKRRDIRVSMPFEVINIVKEMRKEISSDTISSSIIIEALAWLGIRSLNNPVSLLDIKEVDKSEH